MCVCLCVCVFVYVWVRERERERDRCMILPVSSGGCFSQWRHESLGFSSSIHPLALSDWSLHTHRMTQFYKHTHTHIHTHRMTQFYKHTHTHTHTHRKTQFYK